MRILQVITSLSMGGAEKLVAEISPRLRDKGHEVDVLTFDGANSPLKESLLEKNINVISLGVNCSVYNPLFILRIAKLIQYYDVIHTHNTAPQLFIAISSIFSRKILITTEHNTSNRRRNWRWYTWIDKWMYSRYKSIICISDKAEQNLRKYISNIKNVCTIYNGIDIQHFYTAKPLPLIKKDKIIVTMVAGFRYQKDQDTLIRAFLQLDNQYELWLIGDGERRNELETLVRNLGLSDSVKFLGIKTNIPQLLQTSDIVVMSSHYEGLSLSSIEGMSVNKPFVASDVDGLREVVDGYGILFPHGDDKALSSIITSLAKDNMYYDYVASKCWERAQMYDIQKMVDAYDQVYKGII